jgi:hypothetical protein
MRLAMCNLYSITKGQQAIRDLAGAMRNLTGNLPMLPGVFPDYSAPIDSRRKALPALSQALAPRGDLAYSNREVEAPSGDGEAKG